MIPPDFRNWIFPKFADGTDDAAVLRHDCGIAFQFEVNKYRPWYVLNGVEHQSESHQEVVTNDLLRKWRATIEEVAEAAGESCFSDNTLEPTIPGVYHDRDGNTFAILFSPGPFLEHNDVEGKPLFLVINEKACILTGSQSEAGMKLLEQYLPRAMADSIVTINSDWSRWIALDH